MNTQDNELDRILETLWTKETPFGQQLQGQEEAKQALTQLINTKVREARLDEQKRTDGAYLRFRVKESIEGDYIGAETDWLSRDERIAQLSNPEEK